MPEINGSTTLQARQNLSHTLLSNVRLHLFGQPDVVSQVDCTDGEQQDSSERFKLEPICSPRSKPEIAEFGQFQFPARETYFT